jgi:hypothetical protein
MVIKRIGVLRLAVFQSAMMAAFGLLAGLVVMMFGAMLHTGGAAMGGMIGGVAAVIMFPIIYAIIGFVAGAIGGALYNLVASVVGGIEIEVE